MGSLTLDVQHRDILGKKVKRLRQQGLLPATIYGKGFEPLAVQIDERTFNTTYRQAGRTALIELNIPGTKKQSVFIHAIQRHPVSRAIIHADFRVVDLQKPVNVEVPIVLVGESPLVKRGEALVNHGVTAVEVQALPASIPQHIEVDISDLNSFEDNIRVGDLPPSDSYQIMTDAADLVVSLAHVRVAKSDEEGEEEERPTEPELIRKERKEEEEDEEE